MVTIMSEPNISTEGNPLQAFRIANLPPDFYYIPNFISAEEEGSILGKVRA
jgi:alkylated DNA repair protein alkB family protein 6